VTRKVAKRVLNSGETGSCKEDPAWWAYFTDCRKKTKKICKGGRKDSDGREREKVERGMDGPSGAEGGGKPSGGGTARRKGMKIC